MFFELLGIFFCLLLFFFGLFMILFYNLYCVVLLLSLEFVLLGVVGILGMVFFNQIGLMGIFLFFLVMVCLGGFSVSLLVSLYRDYGRDSWLGDFIF